MRKFKQLPIQSALAIALLLGASQSAFSHTRLETPVVVEGLRTSNNVVISHGCGDGTKVIASSGSIPRRGRFHC